MSFRVVVCPHCQNQMRVVQQNCRTLVACPSCQNKVKIAPLGSPSQRPPVYSQVPDQGPIPSNPIHATPIHGHPNYSTPTPRSRTTIRQQNLSAQSSGFVKKRSRTNTWLIVGALGIIGLLFLTTVGGGVFFVLWVKQRNETVAENEFLQQGEQNQQQIQNRSSNSKEGWNRSESSNSIADANDGGNLDVGSRSDKLIFELNPNQEYTYYYSLSTRIGETQTRFHGFNKLNGQSGQNNQTRRGTSAQKVDFSVVMTHDRKQLQTNRVAFSRPEIINSKGRLFVDSKGDCSFDSEMELLPFLMQPIGMIGVERMEPYETSWTDQQEFVLTEMSEPNDDRLEMFLRSSSMYRRGRMSEATRPRFGTTIMRRITEYRVVANTSNEIHVKKSVTVGPIQTTGNSNASTIFEAQGQFVFDKRLGIVTRTELEGNAKINAGKLTATLPVKYSAKYKSAAEIQADRDKAPANSSSAGGVNDKSSNAQRQTSQSNTTNETAREIDATGKIVGVIEDIRWGAKAINFARPKEVSFLIVGKIDEFVQVYDWKNSKMTDQSEKLTAAGRASALIATPDGSHILYSGHKGAVYNFGLSENGKLIEQGKFMGHASEVSAIAITSDGKRALSGGRGKRARLWDLETNKEIAVFGGFEGKIIGLRFLNDDKLAVVCDGRSIYKIDIENEAIRSKTKLSKPVNQGAFSPDGSFFVYAKGRDVIVVETTNCEQVEKIQSDYFPKGFNFSNDNRNLYWGTSKRAHVFDWESKNTIKFQVNKTFGLEQVAFAPDGVHIAIATGASTGKVVLMKMAEDESEQN